MRSRSWSWFGVALACSGLLVAGLLVLDAPPRFVISVNTEPPAGEVWADGEPVGKGPVELELTRVEQEMSFWALLLKMDWKAFGPQGCSVAGTWSADREVSPDSVYTLRYGRWRAVLPTLRSTPG